MTSPTEETVWTLAMLLGVAFSWAAFLLGYNGTCSGC